MKYISFAIPCYNSQDYMAHAIESILPGGEDIEIIIVNDGSKDRTSEIAHEYMEKYPTIIKVVDKENGGHGDAVNSGLMHATGKYFKVVDSDDWVDEDALHKILDVLRHMEEDGMELDMLIANYVYEKVGATHKKVIHYRNVLPQDEIFRWDDMGHFHLDQYFDLIAGASMDEKRVEKADVIRYALEKAGITDVTNAVMIGDREYDILGAKENGLDSIGVLYGYGSKKELEAAGAGQIAETVEELWKILRQNSVTKGNFT